MGYVKGFLFDAYVLCAVVSWLLQLPNVQAEVVEHVFSSIAAEDGWVLESAQRSDRGGRVNAAGVGARSLRIGDDSRNLQYKSFLSFDTSFIPDAAVISSAEIELTAGGVWGEDPSVSHGMVRVDLKAGYFGNRRGLESVDFQAKGDLSLAAAITCSGGLGVICRFTLEPEAAALLIRSGGGQIRVCFGLDDDGDNQEDSFGFYAADAKNGAKRPVLRVLYDDGGQPTPLPTESASPSPEPTATGTLTPQPTATTEPTPRPTDTVTPTPRPTATATPTPRPTETPTPRPTATATSTPQPTGTATPTPTQTAIPSPVPTGIWRPRPGTSWQWQLTGTINTAVNVQMYDIDLFDAPQQVINTLHAAGRVVICYFSAGSWEDWRPDTASFPAVVKGNSNGWPGEKWLDIRNIEALAPVMRARLDLAVQKGCDGVEPDNVDGYTNNTGFPLKYADQINYNRWMAAEAHARGLSIGLKNDIDQVADLVGDYDWALNEQCFQYNECDTLKPFVQAGKAVFGVEYQGSTAVFCPKANSLNFDWLKKNLDLDATREACR